MSETLDRAKARRRGRRGVVTKYIQEVKALVDTESIEPGLIPTAYEHAFQTARRETRCFKGTGQ